VKRPNVRAEHTKASSDLRDLDPRTLGCSLEQEVRLGLTRSVTCRHRHVQHEQKAVALSEAEEGHARSALRQIERLSRVGGDASA
jgi:hypothetical protein